jgi:Protein of unknown function (DUF2934)
MTRKTRRRQGPPAREVDSPAVPPASPVAVSAEVQGEPLISPIPRRAAGPPSHEDIEWRAYEIFEARKGTGDLAVDDWLQAERELRAGRVPS